MESSVSDSRELTDEEIDRELAKRCCKKCFGEVCSPLGYAGVEWTHP